MKICDVKDCGLSATSKLKFEFSGLHTFTNDKIALDLCSGHVALLRKPMTDTPSSFLNKLVKWVGQDE